MKHRRAMLRKMEERVDGRGDGGGGETFVFVLSTSSVECEFIKDAARV